MLKHLEVLVLLFCIASILIAYYIQFYLKITPCNLCYIERWFLYFYIILFAFNKYCFLKIKQTIIFYILCIANFFAGCCVCFYHILIERGIVVSSCLFDVKMLSSTISCAIIGFELFGFSLSSIIFLFYLCILFALSTKYLIVFIKKSDLEVF